MEKVKGVGGATLARLRHLKARGFIPRDEFITWQKGNRTPLMLCRDLIRNANEGGVAGYRLTDFGERYVEACDRDEITR